MNLGYRHDLQAAAPCEGKAVEYVATAFVTNQARGALGRQVALGRAPVDPTDLRTSAKRVLDELKPEEQKRLIGINYFRFCNLKPHNYLQLERVGAIAYTKTDPNVFAINPDSLKTVDGIGVARSTLATNHLFIPVIDFSTLSSERESNPAMSVVEAAVARPGNQAYIALRGLESVVAAR